MMAFGGLRQTADGFSPSKKKNPFPAATEATEKRRLAGAWAKDELMLMMRERVFTRRVFMC